MTTDTEAMQMIDEMIEEHVWGNAMRLHGRGSGGFVCSLIGWDRANKAEKVIARSSGATPAEAIAACYAKWRSKEN